jgi:hypothetical protein
MYQKDFFDNILPFLLPIIRKRIMIMNIQAAEFIIEPLTT